MGRTESKLNQVTMTQTMWEFYSTSPSASRQRCVEEWKFWLSEVKDSSERHRLQNALEGADSTHHFSARLELFFHYYFVSTGWEIQWHPTLPDTSHKPEFLLSKGQQEILLEANIAAQEQEVADMVEFCNRLKAELERIRLPLEVNFDVSLPTPPLSLFDVVKEELIEFVSSQLTVFDQGAEPEKDVRWVSDLQGTRCQIDFTLRRQQINPGPNLSVWYIYGGWSGMHNKLYENIERKANRYGKPDRPFVIGVWGLDHPDMTNEKWALYGTQAIQIPRDAEGNPIGPAKTGTNPNGIFLVREDGQLKHRHVSTVVLYQHKLRDEDHQHEIRVYHNPYALHPPGQSVFSGYPQYIRIDDGPGEWHMQWVPHEPQE